MPLLTDSCPLPVRVMSTAVGQAVLGSGDPSLLAGVRKFENKVE